MAKSRVLFTPPGLAVCVYFYGLYSNRNMRKAGFFRLQAFGATRTVECQTGEDSSVCTEQPRCTISHLREQVNKAPIVVYTLWREPGNPHGWIILTINCR